MARTAAQYLANVRNHPDSAVTHSTSPMRAAVRAISNQGIQLDLVGGDRETPANSEGIDPAIVEEANDVMNVDAHDDVAMLLDPKRPLLA
jgi:protein gp37